MNFGSLTNDMLFVKIKSESFCRNIEVDSISNLRKVRQWLTEKCSVFGVTLQYKEKRFAKPVNGAYKTSRVENN